MADDLPDFPIVVLENDHPEQIGKPGLFDFLMPVGSTGIIFVAALRGILQVQGPVFSEADKAAARIRAASTLVHWGIVNGDTFAFIREAIPYTQQEAADRLGVPLLQVQDWESGVEPVPRLVWNTLAEEVVRLDGRHLPPELACPPNFRGRRIRVFPNVPRKSTAQQRPAPGQPGAGGIPGCPPPPPTC